MLEELIDLTEDPDEVDFLDDEPDDASASTEVDEDGRLYEQYRFVADAGQALLRIDKFLVCRITKLSRSRIQDAADAGFVLVNGTPVKSNYRVKPNDIVIVMAVSYTHLTLPTNREV